MAGFVESDQLTVGRQMTALEWMVESVSSMVAARAFGKNIRRDA
jgi:hypothetical protein